MRQVFAIGVAILLLLSAASPSGAAVASIESSAPLQDHGQQSIESALKAAVTAASKRALAMGLPWIKVSQIQVGDMAVAVSILATDVRPESNQDKSLTFQGGLAPSKRPETLPDDGM